MVRVRTILKTDAISLSIQHNVDTVFELIALKSCHVFYLCHTHDYVIPHSLKLLQEASRKMIRDS